MKAWKRGVACMTVLATLVCGLSFGEAYAATSVKLSTSKVTLTVGKTKKVRVKNYKKKVTWSSSKKAVATVTKVGKYVGKIKAKKAGSAKIYAKCGKKKLICKVTVKKQSTPQKTETVVSATPTVKPTTKPVTKATVNPVIKATTKPAVSVNEDQKYLADQRIDYDQEEGIYHLYFSIRLSDNQTKKAYAGTVELQVYNTYEELVYNQNKSFTLDNFMEEGQEGTDECLCDVEIPASEFVAGSSTEGTLYYSVILEDDTWFSKRTLEIYSLPVRVTEQPIETLSPIITKVPNAEPTQTAVNSSMTPIPTLEVTEEPKETARPTKVPETETPTPTVTPSASPTPTMRPTGTPKPTATCTPNVTVSPTPEVPENRDEVLENSMKALRVYVIVNGKLDSNGNFCLEWESENRGWKYGISCNLITDEVTYYVEGMVNGYDTVLRMESDPFNNRYSKVKCSCSSQDLSQQGMAILSFENVNYNVFESRNFLTMGTISDIEMQNAANLLLHSGMEMWDCALDEIGLSFNQVGYDNYGRAQIQSVDTKYPVNQETTTTASTLKKWKEYIQSVGETVDNEVQRIYMEDGDSLYFVDYDSFNDLFTYGMEKEDGTISLNITIHSVSQTLSTIIYKDKDRGTVYKTIDVGTLLGTENLSFEAEGNGSWVQQVQQNANVCLRECYTKWSCLAQCAGMTLNNVGFDSYD